MHVELTGLICTLVFEDDLQKRSDNEARYLISQAEKGSG